jgi:hypothetical protein
VQDYNHKLAQTRAGRSSKSKLLLAKFSQANAAEGWELREGLYFTDEIAGKYDGGMDAQFEVAEDGNATFSGMQRNEVRKITDIERNLNFFSGNLSLGSIAIVFSINVIFHQVVCASLIMKILVKTCKSQVCQQCFVCHCYK